MAKGIGYVRSRAIKIRMPYKPIPCYTNDDSLLPKIDARLKKIEALLYRIVAMKV